MIATTPTATKTPSSFIAASWSCRSGLFAFAIGQFYLNQPSLNVFFDYSFSYGFRNRSDNF